MLDYRIKTFLALSETMNYRKAAEELHITQPAVTRHIQSLERDYGCKLTTYDCRKLELTPQGETLLRYARNVAYQECRLEGELTELSGLSLRIGATKTIGDYVIGPHIARYLASGRRIAEVTVGNTEMLLGRVERGELDFAVIEGAFDRTMFEGEIYRPEPFVGLCSSRHRFAGNEVPLREALGECLLIREHGSGTRAIFEQQLAAESHGVNEFSRVVGVSSFGLMTRLLVDLDAITFGYEAIQKDNEALSTFRIEGWDIVRNFSYVFLDNDAARFAVSLFSGFQGNAG